MSEFVWWLIIGLTAGGLARFLYNAKHPTAPFETMTLGMIGSLIGGAISAAIFDYRPLNPGSHPAGIVMSTLGALFVLAGFVANSRRSAPVTKRVR
jgi:uncharacterized membrane protein YeaQ/YmgE (transglycosylase-associated protein family)